MKFWLIISFVFCLGWSQAAAQSVIGPRISDIMFEGNQRTQSDYLALFLTSKNGELLDFDQLKIDQQRLKNLSSIQDAQIMIDTLRDASVVVRFQVSEVRTLLPIVGFGGIKENFWYQLGVADINQAGRGRQLLAYYQNNDRRHNGEIFFKNPFIRGSRWGYTAGLLKYASIEPLYFDGFPGEVSYAYDLLNASASSIYHLNVNRELEVGVSLFQEKYEKRNSDAIETPGPIALEEWKVLGKFRFQQDNLNYHYFYLNNHHFWAQYQAVFNTRDQLWFQTFTTTYRRYWRLGMKGNLATRFRFGLSTNRNTPFAPFVADSFTNLRGIGNRIDRGTAQIIWNVEYRQTVYDQGNWAGQFVGFMDVGTWRTAGGRFSQVWDSDQFRQFMGGGVRVIYKKVFGAILRIDFGIDIYNPEERGFVIGFGQYF